MSMTAHDTPPSAPRPIPAAQLPSLVHSPPVTLADWLRRRLLRASGGLARPFVRSRRLRVHTGAALALVSATLTSVFTPLLSLFLLPLVLGVPHLLADLRFLGPSFPGWRVLGGVGVGAVLATILGVGLLDLPQVGALSLVVVAWAAPGTPIRRLVVALLGLGALAWMQADEAGFRLTLAHAHHAIALLLWWLWCPRRPGDLWFPLAAAGLTGLILSGLLDAPILHAAGAIPAIGPGWGAAELWLAPRGSEAPWRWVTLYALGQSLHYLVWLRLIPDEARPTETPRSFARSVEVLEESVGRPLLWLLLAVALGVLMVALVDLQTGWTAYMRFAVFHAWLELAALGLLFAAALPLREAS